MSSRLTPLTRACFFIDYSFFFVRVDLRFEYFFINFSTRPAESTIFCFPVKNGWQFEQRSTEIFSTVDLVSIVLPQAQVMIHFTYFG